VSNMVIKWLGGIVWLAVIAGLIYLLNGAVAP